VLVLIARLGVVQREHRVAQGSPQATDLQRLQDRDLTRREHQRHPVVVGGQDKDFPPSAGEVTARRHPLSWLASR